MTLIAQVWTKKFGILVGDGRTNTNGKVINDSLRKIYIEKNLAIGFAGNTWISEEMGKKGIFIPNYLEDFISQEYDEDINNLSIKLNKLLKKLNPQLNTEFFIFSADNGSVKAFNLNLSTENLRNESQRMPEFGILLSRFDDEVNEKFKEVLIENWKVKFNDENPFKDLELINSLDINDFVEFLVEFFEDIFTNYNKLVDNSIGESIDIIIVEPDNIRFLQKNNLTIEEMKANV